MIKKATNQFVRLDTDTDNNSIGQGENAGAYRYALNCRVRSSKDGNAGATENVRGNIEVENEFLPEGVNTCIGTCQDDANNRLIFFNHNSDGNHGIYSYSEIDNSIIVVLETSTLNFSTDNLINSRIIDKFLVWLDGVNPQRSININRAIAGQYTTPIIPQQINLGKQPPNYPPLVSYVIDDTKNFNYVSGRLFQFRLRYIYFDDEKTTLSPISDIPIDYNSLRPKYSEYNCIEVGFGKDLLGNDLFIKTPQAQNIIKAVEIFVRGSDYVIDANNLNNISVNRNNWKSVAVITDYVATDYLFRFYNDSNFQLLDTEQANKLYEALPITSQALEIKNNRIFLANNEEDYDDVVLDIELETDFKNYGETDSVQTEEFFEFNVKKDLQVIINTAFQQKQTTILFDEETPPPLFDNGGNFNTSTGEYLPLATVTSDFFFQTDVTEGGTGTGSYQIYLVIVTAAGVETLYDTTAATPIAPTPPSTQAWQWSNITVQQNGKAYIMIATEEDSGTGTYTTSFSDNYFYNDVTSITAISTTIPTRSDLKRGGSYEFVLAYFDLMNRSTTVCTRNKESTVIVNGEERMDKVAKVDIPFFTEDLNKYFPTKYPTPNTYKRGRCLINWTINHTPPIWASHYAWLRTLNTAQNRFLQYMVQAAYYVQTYDQSTTDSSEISSKSNPQTSYYAGANEIYLSFENIVYYKNENSDSQISAYIPEPNDRIRLMLKKEDTPPVDPELWDWYDFIDVPIKALRGRYIVIDVRDIDNNVIDIEKGAIVELYTPQLRQDNYLYYEIVEIFPILNPFTAERTHSRGYSNTAQDQTDTLPATGTFHSGDIWYRSREMFRYEVTNVDIPYPVKDDPFTREGTRNVFVEDLAVSDIYYSVANDTGRINIYNPNSKQTQKTNYIRFSNKIISGTRINGLSNYEPLNEKDLPIEYGSINALRIAGKSQQDGNTMLAFMTTETLSMYINEAVIKQTGNAGQLTAIADDVIASVNELQGGYGCQHPESIVGNQNYVYWYDARKGVACRYATNGLYPISNYGVSRYMLDKSLQLKIIPNFKDKRVFGGYDFIADEYILTFANTQEATEVLPAIVKETIGFYEPENRWTSFYSFTPEFYGKVGTTFISFIGGKLYTHNDKQNYNRFYGVKYDSKLAYVMNEAPLNEKIYKTMVLKGSLSIEGTPPNETEEFWYAEKFETNLNQLSTLFPENYEKDSYPDTRIESAFYAPILKNELTPNVTDPIFNGELMRGEVLIVHLICKASKLCVLRFAQVGYLPSLGE